MHGYAFRGSTGHHYGTTGGNVGISPHLPNRYGQLLSSYRRNINRVAIASIGHINNVHGYYCDCRDCAAKLSTSFSGICKLKKKRGWKKNTVFKRVKYKALNIFGMRFCLEGA